MKIVGPVIAIRTQVALTTAYSIIFTFQVDKKKNNKKSIIKKKKNQKSKKKFSKSKLAKEKYIDGLIVRQNIQ